jgi:hypothetical protein
MLYVSRAWLHYNKRKGGLYVYAYMKPTMGKPGGILCRFCGSQMYMSADGDFRCPYCDDVVRKDY